MNIILSRNDPEKVLDSSGDSVVDIKELTRKFSKKAVEEYEKAQEEHRKGNPARAAERLQNALKISPDFYYAHNYLGQMYEKLKRPGDAEREFKIARDQNPRFFEPLVNLGRLYVQEVESRVGEGAATIGPTLDQARDVLQEAVKLQPNSATAHYLLGVVHYRSSRDEEAEPILKRALEIGDRGPARLVLANLYIRQHKWESALEHLDAYLKANPKSPDRPQIEGIRARVVQNMKAANP